jgi:(S)-ureidoglycine aminohydrolase
MTLFGQTRTQVKPDHAIIAPDGHVPTALSGWKDAQAVVLISPQLGARFSQYLTLMEAGGEGVSPLPGLERFLYVLGGGLHLHIESSATELAPGGFAYLPADTPHTLMAEVTSRLCVFERRYLALGEAASPAILVGNEAEVASEAFMGDPGLTVKKLLPELPGFDMAVNTMLFAPGTPLPFVETHVMEHGLLMLGGGGIYRLGDHWYPVTQGDAIWMGPYCPQWFAALGKEPAKYLLYKDVNRDPFTSWEEG